MSYILNGKFYKGEADVNALLPRPTSVYKQSNHDQQRLDHGRDLLQPYNRDGTVNQEFVTQYPEESQETYKFIKTDEELAKEK